MVDLEGSQQSAMETLDAEQYLVLMGGPGSGKTTFLNFVALCMSGEPLHLATAHLELLPKPILPEREEYNKEKPTP
jgi:predicted NACHT family NTPase